MNKEWEDLIRSNIAATGGKAAKAASGRVDFAAIKGDWDPEGQQDPVE
jgi:hypothetical protein